MINRTKVVRRGSKTEAELARQQWRALSSVAACGVGDEMKNWATNRLGRRMGVCTSWLALPGRPRHVAVRSDGRRRASPMRRLISESVNTVARHSVLHSPTDRPSLTVISS